MFTDPDNYNQRDTERDFPTFGESSEIKKSLKLKKNNYPIYPNNTEFTSFGSKNPNLINTINNIKEDNNNNNLNENLVESSTIENWLNKFKCNLSFLEEYFNIDTEEIKERLISSIIPLNNKFYNLVEPKPDLYGTIWIYTTLIFVISASASLTKYLKGINNEDYFQQFIPVAAYVIYGIGFSLPLIIYICFYLFGSNVSFVLILCIYSYSFTIYIPIMILCIPVEKLQWIFLLFAILHSTTFLLINFWNELNKFIDSRKYFILGIICIFQICLYIILKIKFFKHIKITMNS